jgi:hypothetical protein
MFTAGERDRVLVTTNHASSLMFHSVRQVRTSHIEQRLPEWTIDSLNRPVHTGQ